MMTHRYRESNKYGAKAVERSEKNEQRNSYKKHKRETQKERDILGRKIKEPNIKNVNVIFNGDNAGFDLFIKSLLSDYLHSGDVDKSPLTDVVDKVEINETYEKVVDF